MKYNVVLIIMMLVGLSTTAQSISPIIQVKRYSQEVSYGNDNYYFLGQYYIDPKKKGIIDLKSIEKGILKVVKDKNYSEYIVLDIENKVYHELRTNSKNHVNYKKNIKSLVEVVNLVKKLRPKSKVVIYNIPFKFISSNQKSNNDYEKLYPLLQAVDALTPSLYLNYTDTQKKSAFFSSYIDDNLDLCFEYAERLNKKVYPFIWYKIHPSNRKHGGDVIASKQYANYLNLIKKYRYKSSRVEKVIYWEPAKETVNVNDWLDKTVKVLKN